MDRSSGSKRPTKGGRSAKKSVKGTPSARKKSGTRKAEEELEEIEELLESFQDEVSGASQEDVEEVISAVERHLEDGPERVNHPDVIDTENELMGSDLDSKARKWSSEPVAVTHAETESGVEMDDVTFEPPDMEEEEFEAGDAHVDVDDAAADIEDEVESEVEAPSEVLVAATKSEEPQAEEGETHTANEEIGAAREAVEPGPRVERAERTLKEVDRAIVKELDTMLMDGEEAVEEAIEREVNVQQVDRREEGEVAEAVVAESAMVIEEREFEANEGAVATVMEEPAVESVAQESRVASNAAEAPATGELSGQDETMETFESVANDAGAVATIDEPATIEDAVKFDEPVKEEKAEAVEESKAEVMKEEAKVEAAKKEPAELRAQVKDAKSDGKGERGAAEVVVKKPMKEKGKRGNAALVSIGGALQGAVVTVLSAINAPLRMVPGTFQPVLNWAAISLLAWVPVVWMLVWRADAQLQMQQTKADFVEAGMVDPTPPVAETEHGESGHGEASEGGHSSGHEAKKKEKPKEKKSTGHSAKKSEGHGEE